MDKPCDSNEQNNADTISVPETITVGEKHVCCDGEAMLGKGMGHPVVWLAIGPKGWVECPYCDARFIYDPS